MGKRPSATTLDPEMSVEELSGMKGWLLSNQLKGTHLEIGTAAGGTLCFMMECFTAENRPPFSVVDTMSYFDDQIEIVKRNLSNHDLDANSVDFRTMASAEAFAQADAKQEKFDFILVDASHKIRHVMNDLRWMRLLNVGGIACFHDYIPVFKGVRWPIDRFLKRNSHFVRVGQAGSLLCIRKEREAASLEVTASDRFWSLVCSPILQWDLSIQKRRKRWAATAAK
ncbi:class I SAM-dependent methyltransferase [bacterium]|nr:class I SAM-dependent methyltransferase [bacterium]